MEVFLNKKNILWDFDGVIIESAEVREMGFTDVLKAYPKDQVDDLLQYHQANGGLSRYVKFRYFFNEIREEEVSEDRITDLANQFSEIMREKLIQKEKLLPDTIKFIRRNYNSYNMHIVSGSDGKELNYLTKALGISKYFRSIEGSPTPKIDLVKNLLHKYSYSPSGTVLIGDSINDFEAAEINKIAFFGYNNEELRGLGSGYLNSFI